jgi:cell division protein FtsI/penicillin-binding protein 2
MITLLAGCVLVIVAQLFKVQVIDHKFYAKWAEEQRVRAIEMAQPPRGAIRDRDGYLMAGNRVRYAVDAAPAYVMDKAGAATALASELHLPASHLEAQLRRRDDKGEYPKYLRIAPSVSKEVGERVAKLDIVGITIKPRWRRVYPEGSMAAHALGFTAVVTGYYGVEGFYDDMLRPEPVEWKGPVDPASVPIPWEPVHGDFPRRGVNLVLTLDRTVQALAEEELARAMEEYQAEAGTIIVMEPKTFGILGMASLPNYDPEDYVRCANEDPLLFEDPAVSRQYEPGSVFKIVTVGAALDSGTVTPNSVYHDEGWIEVGGQAIYNATQEAYGDQTVTDILVKSLNVGAAWLSTTMGPDLFYQYVQDFGFGELTNVDLDGEVRGQLWLPEDFEHWHPSNLGTNAFGQGVAVTPLQMITAVATVANDGARLRPHIVDRRLASDGTPSVFHPVLKKQVLEPETARTLTEMLVQAVEEGATLAQVEGYRVAGKTGTAQIPIPGGYDREGTIATFVGFGPVPAPGATGEAARAPELVVLVKLDRPQTSPWASRTAAPTFQRLMGQLFTVLGIPPTSLPATALLSPDAQSGGDANAMMAEVGP